MAKEWRHSAFDEASFFHRSDGALVACFTKADEDESERLVGIKVERKAGSKI
jgi:hypothetical protein